MSSLALRETGGAAVHQSEASVSSSMSNKRGKFLFQINIISKSSDFYRDPLDNWCFYERLWMTIVSHLRERNLICLSFFYSLTLL